MNNMPTTEPCPSCNSTSLSTKIKGKGVIIYCCKCERIGPKGYDAAHAYQKWNDMCKAIRNGDVVYEKFGRDDDAAWADRNKRGPAPRGWP